MKKCILCILTAMMLLSFTACNSSEYTEAPPETTRKPVTTQDAAPSASPKATSTPSPASTPATVTKTPTPTKTPKAPGWAVTLEDYVGGNYEKAISEVTDKNIRTTPDSTESIVLAIAITGDCNFTLMGLGYGMPYGDTTRRLAEMYGDPVHSTDEFCEFEINGEFATISLSTADGKTVNFVELRKKLA